MRARTLFMVVVTALVAVTTIPALGQNPQCYDREVSSEYHPYFEALESTMHGTGYDEPYRAWVEWVKDTWRDEIPRGYTFDPDNNTSPWASQQFTRKVYKAMQAPETSVPSEIPAAPAGAADMAPNGAKKRGGTMGVVVALIIIAVGIVCLVAIGIPVISGALEKGAKKAAKAAKKGAKKANPTGPPLSYEQTRLAMQGTEDCSRFAIDVNSYGGVTVRGWRDPGAAARAEARRRVTDGPPPPPAPAPPKPTPPPNS